jgi:hypothetical protein
MITISRYTNYGDYEKETFGVLTFGEFTCYTVERPWEDNEPFVSCIPDGDYYLHSHSSPRFGDTVIIYGGTVAPYTQTGFERSGILVHPANTADELKGCIGLGDSFGTVYGKHAVMNSRKTVAAFLELINNNEIYNLEINYDAL